MEASRVIWMDGELVPWEDAPSTCSRSAPYGSGVFEGIRAYATDSGPAIFRHREHMQRLVNSAKAMVSPRTVRR